MRGQIDRSVGEALGGGVGEVGEDLGVEVGNVGEALEIKGAVSGQEAPCVRASLGSLVLGL